MSAVTLLKFNDFVLICFRSSVVPTYSNLVVFVHSLEHRFHILGQQVKIITFYCRNTNDLYCFQYCFVNHFVFVFYPLKVLEKVQSHAQCASSSASYVEYKLQVCKYKTHYYIMYIITLLSIISRKLGLVESRGAGSAHYIL